LLILKALFLIVFELYLAQMSLLALVILHPLLHILDVLMILFEPLVVSISHLLYLLISSLLSPQVVLLSLHL